jgi:hypothetical protein
MDAGLAPRRSGARRTIEGSAAVRRVDTGPDGEPRGAWQGDDRVRRSLGHHATVKTLREGATTPTPPSEWRAWLIALALCLLGAGVLAAVLGGGVGSSTGAPAADPPAVLLDAAVPLAANASEAAVRSGRGTVAGPYDHARGAVPSAGAVVASPPAEGSEGHPEAHISAGWEAGFYPIYAEAQRVFGVNWLLLASIHMQETAFSTAPSTYRGLNFAHCCGGPMQFNITNGGAGISSTWDLVKEAYRFGRRPTAYDHPTARHPSIYDDYDAIMAAAWLLYSDGAGAALDDSAWWAAYDYYGHDAYGVQYADEVVARAIGWSQHGFCVNCGVDSALVQAVNAAYGAPVVAALEAEEATARPRARQARKGHGTRRHHRTRQG